MFKVKYRSDIYTVLDIKIEKFEYSYKELGLIKQPVNTWFLIWANNEFVWVPINECEYYDSCTN